jgi:TP901 family phage tail tape measure protein
MADAQSNIKVSIDTTEALASIKNLQRQISAFHTSMAKSGAAANAVTSQMQQNLINSVNATGKFSAQMKTIKTTTESFTDSLQKNKFSMGEYFRYAGGASKSFGRLFKTEFETINKVARENVKDLQTQYIKMGRDANGAMKAIAVRPLALDMNDLATKTMIASEKQALLNQLLKQGSTNLLNFGKNTQWAGRQLMVGFTIPLMAVGSAAAKTFMDMETQAIRFKKVYGDLFTPASETQEALDGITELGKQFTKYGVAVSSTVNLAAEAAAAGFKGLDLQRQTAAATKLSILGQVESQKALETTIALQNAFSMSSEDLATNIDFLNAVENQTVLSLDDMSTAIPKAAPVVQQLGGDVKDLAFFMTAMKEGGINASEGANALKSGLASMINPTGKAAAMLEGFGINIKKIVVDNKGDLKKTVIDFATALNQLDPLNRAQAIEQMFGKFQFARLSTLFANVTKEGTQAARVLDLAGASVQDLASLSEKELGMTSESAMNKFKASVENLKLALVPVGEEFLKAVTPIAEFVTKILDKFNNLGDGTKKIIVTLTAIVAGLGPVLLMTFGLLANGLANIIKGFTAMKTLFNKTGQSSATLGTEVKYMTLEQRNAAAVAASLDQVHRNLAQTFTSEATAVNALTRAYQRSIAAQSQFMPVGKPMGRGPIKKRAKGKPAVVGGTGNQDSELALLQPGETVIPTKMSKKYGSLINGMIADNIPGYMSGKSLAFAHASMPFAPGSAQYSEGIKLAGLDRLVQEFPEMIRVVSNLVAEIPQAMNVQMKTGAPLGAFEQEYASRGGKFLASATLGGLDAANKDEVIALQKLEDEIGKRTISMAKATKEQLVTDDLFAKATREVIDEQLKLKGAARKAAQALNAASQQVGQVRVSASQAGIRAGLASGKFRRTRKSTQTQNQIMFDDVNIGRESASNPNTFYSGNPITPKGSYRRSKKRSIAAVQIEAQQDAAAYNTVVEKNTEDIYKKSRKRKSPHPLASQDGRDDAVAYQTAVEKSIARNQRKNAKRAQVAPTVIPSRMSRMKGAASNVGGKLAGRAGAVGMAGSSAMMAASFLPGKAGEIAQKAMPVAFGLQALQMALKLPIPHLKAVAAVSLAAYGAFKLFNAAREKERLAIEGLGDAARVSEKKLKTLGDFFGIVPTKIDYLSKDNAAAATGATPQEQSAIDSLQQNKQFQKDFKNDIESLKKGTQAQAKLVFDSIAIQLRGSGFAKEQIDLIIKALQEESGKTDFKFDFANIDLSTDKGILNFDQNFGAIIKEIDAGVTQVFVSARRVGEVNKVVNQFADGARANIKLASEAATGFINGLSAQLRNGTISAEQFNQGFARIHSTIATMPRPEQVLVLDAVFKTLPENLQKATSGLTNTGQRMEILQAQSLGLTGAALALADAFKVLNSPQVWGPEGAMKLNDAQTTINKIKKQVADYAKFLEKTFKSGSNGSTNPYKDPDTGGSGKGKTLEEQYLEILDKQIDALQAKLDAQKKINDEIQREIDLANKLQDLESQAVNAKITGNYIQASLLKEQSKQAKAEFDRETALNRQQDPIDALIARKKAIQDGAKLTAAEKAQIPKKANGGLIKGPGTGRSDSIRATLGYAGGGSIRVSNGEFVVKASSVRDYGLNAMNAVNNGTATIDTNSGGTVYNINMPITANQSDPKAVGDYVMRQLKIQLDKNNRSNKVEM